MEFVHVELKRDTWMGPDRKVKNPEDAIKEVKRLIENMDREMLISINLAADGSVINASICSIGTINQSMVSTSEIFRTALVSGAANIILVHNHPSGSVKASQDDLKATRRCAIAGKMLNIILLDHIIIGSNDKLYSLAENYSSCFEASKNEIEKLLMTERVS